MTSNLVAMPIPTIDMAISMGRSVHTAAVASRTTLQERLAEAHEALQAAQAARAALVADATAGRLIDPARAASVDADLRSAAATVALLSEALAPHDEQVAQAAETVAVLTAEAEYEAFQQRIHARIDAAARVDAACAALAAAYAEYVETGDDLLGNWPGRTKIEQHELEYVRERRNAAWRVPAELQAFIVQTKSVNVIPSLADRERGTWHSRLPAPAKAA